MQLALGWADWLGSWAGGQAVWSEWRLGSSSAGPEPSMTFAAVQICRALPAPLYILASELSQAL